MNRVNRYNKFGIHGLIDQSKRPKKFSSKKLTDDIETQILDLRKTSNLGVRRIQSELIRIYNIRLSIATVHKVLIKYKVKPIKKFLKDTKGLFLWR